MVDDAVDNGVDVDDGVFVAVDDVDVDFLIIMFMIMYVKKF